MAKFKKEPHTRGAYSFRCPGCNSKHIVFTANEGYNHPIWNFNGDLDKPTVRASVLVHARQFNPETGKHDIEIDRCHSFITDGMIQFLPDCMHELAGQTVELPEI